MKEWTTYHLEDICKEILSGGDAAKYDCVKAKSDTYKYPVFANAIDEDGLYGYCNDYVVNVPSVTIAARGAGTGYVAYRDTPYTPIVRLISLIPKENVNPLFLYYRLKIANLRGDGSAIPQLTVPMVKKLKVTLPDHETQKTIADILRSLDVKIQLNKQINDNLEQQASSLLSDWISTYPCRTYKLSDICKYANGKCETGNLTPQNYISTENMLPNKKGIVEASNIPTGKATCFKVDDILIANIRPYFQKIWKADINGGCSADVLCIRANIESHSPILYWLLHQDAFFEYVMTGAKGCKMPRGDKQHIMNWSTDLPEVQYWADLATQLGSIDQQIAYNRIESINLSNLRDTLLPKLMSGEIKINEIDC